MDIETSVLEFVHNELRCKVGADSPLNMGTENSAPEDIYEMMDKYGEVFGVDCSKIYWRKYFPQVVLPFLPNRLLPERLKTDRHKPMPFTTRMLIESAKAGRWLYD